MSVYQEHKDELEKFEFMMDAKELVTSVMDQLKSADR